MAKKGKDLFELLRARQGRSVGRSPRPAPRQKAPPSLLSQIAETMRNWGWRALEAMKLTKKAGGKVARSRPTGKSQTGKNRQTGKDRKGVREVSASPVVSGLQLTRMGLAAIVLVCLGAGFLAGSWLAPTDAAGSGEGLMVRRPSLGSWVLTPEERQEEVKTLSKYFFVLLQFPGSERDRASRLARFLRNQGIETARIHNFTVEKTRQSRWVVLVYVPQQTKDSAEREAPAVLEKLKAVSLPTFEPGFAKRLAELSAGNDLMQLR